MARSPVRGPFVPRGNEMQFRLRDVAYVQHFVLNPKERLLSEMASNAPNDARLLGKNSESWLSMRAITRAADDPEVHKMISL
jgi:hypothetical protein